MTFDHTGMSSIGFAMEEIVEMDAKTVRHLFEVWKEYDRPRIEIAFTDNGDALLFLKYDK